MNNTSEEKLKMITTFVFDVDGTLTDGRVIYDKNGNELKSFFARDGSRISRALKAGFRVYFISSRISPAVTARAKERKISGTILKGDVAKGLSFTDFFTQQNINPREIVYLGDDINDLPFLQQCGVKAAVADASDEVKQIADVVTGARGGYGAVAEIIEVILKAQNKWEESL